MKILFTVPISEERFNVIPDIGQGYLAAYARQAGHNVRFLDCVIERYDLDDFGRYVSQFQPDLLGMKVFSCDLGTVREMLRRVRRMLPETVTLVGGPHPSCEDPERLFEQFPDLDYAFAGEAEAGFSAFLDKLDANEPDMDDIPGLIWRNTDGAVQANPKTFVADLDSLPFPAWDLMDPRRYKSGYSFMTTKLPAAPMSVTRGCPYACTFCGSHLISGRKVRRRSADNVIEEIKLLKRDYGVRTIDIVDENFTFDRAFVAEFCDGLLTEHVDVAWNCPYGVRLDDLDEEIVRLMAQSGCFALSVGVESGAQRILDAIRKKLTVDQVVEKVRMIKRVSSITVQGYFMMGFPEETRDDIEATIRLACALPFDIVTFCPLRVTPGTAIHEQLTATGQIPKDLDYQGMGHHYFVRSYCAVPDDQMRKLYRKAYLRFYLRPRVILNLLRRLRSFAHVKTICVGLGRLVRSPKHAPDRSSAPGAAPDGSSP